MKWIGTQVTYDDLRLKRRLYLESPVAGGSDPDKFLGVNSDGKVIYRTGTQLFSDIGAGITNTVSLLPDSESSYASAGNPDGTANVAGAIIQIKGGEGINTTANDQIGYSGGSYPAITITGENASNSNKGIVELATTAETATGTSAELAVTPDGLKDGFAGSSNITALGDIVDCHGLRLRNNKNITPGDGSMIHLESNTLTDTNTEEGATAATFTSVALEGSAVAAGNADVTITNAATLYVKGPPSAGTNVTLTNPYALWVDSGNVKLDNDLNVDGTITVDTAVVGNLTGNVTGNTSGTAATVTAGTQAAITTCTNLATVGTIGTGVWQGTAIASAYLDADTAHISATKQLTHHGISDDIDSDVVYISLLESDAENTSAANKHLPIIAPAAGKLLKIFCRTTVDQSSETFTWKLYTRTTSQSTNGAAAVIGAQSGAGPTNKTMVTYDFTTGLDSGVGSETNVIAAGDKVQISLEAGDGSTSNGGYFITCLWEWNLS